MRSPRGRGSIPSWAKSTFKSVSERKKKDWEVVTVLVNLTSGCQLLISRSFRGTSFREVTFSIFDQRDDQKDDAYVTMVKKTKYVV